MQRTVEEQQAAIREQQEHTIQLQQAIQAALVREARRSADPQKPVALPRFTTEADRGLTIREWDGALRYLDNDDEEMNLMVAVEVGVSQSYSSLQQAISWSMLSIMRMKKKPRRPIRQATDSCVRAPLDRWCKTGLVTWFGILEKVVIETFRCKGANCPPETVRMV
ncbi:uncharacterized protein V1513DRAFT_427289 [Lipomyces chichibuensis]|uniref:uncharacterized protein n=1 Tax=Lipomyces chichibuensis TaxID=1546026 RepID=UPI0033437337